MPKKTTWKARTLSDKGADHRRAIYAASRPYRKQHIIKEAHDRVNALLQAREGKRSAEERWATAGEAAAILIEAQAALDRLERGKVV